jgi:hypothetical protein
MRYSATAPFSGNDSRIDYPAREMVGRIDHDYESERKSGVKMRAAKGNVISLPSRIVQSNEVSPD